VSGPAKRRALIVGGSMSGLLAALMLQRAGFEADIYERVESELAGRGAGIVAQPDLIGRLRQMAIDSTDLGVEITTRKILDVSGALTGEFVCPQVLTAWERVYRVLRDAFPSEHYHRGRGVERFEQTGAAVAARLADGEIVEGDLLVGADGLRSTIRQQCRSLCRYTPAMSRGARSSPRRHFRPTSIVSYSAT
jgi:2-polyprenyl-6-methoxyphenol hydroxylase-like FAD-dependent oxidoreductase